MILRIIIILCLTINFWGKVKAQVVALPNAHAHNDYNHDRPLLDALAQGFTSVEADVLLIGDELYVGHDMPDGQHQLPTLKAAYLEPLVNHIKANHGKVYPGYDQPIYLMIDFKTEAEETYKVLKKQLADVQQILSVEKDGKLTDGAVRVFISGNRPFETVYQEDVKWVGIDGRPDDLDKNYSASFMPVISDNYFNIIKWDGNGTIPDGDLKKVEKLAKQVHKQNKKLRLWAAPDNENTWKTLLSAGVDLINTDHLEDLHDFLVKSSSE